MQYVHTEHMPTETDTDLYVMNFVSFNSVLKSALAVIYLSLM